MSKCSSTRRAFTFPVARRSAHAAWLTAWPGVWRAYQVSSLQARHRIRCRSVWGRQGRPGQRRERRAARGQRGEARGVASVFADGVGGVAAALARPPRASAAPSPGQPRVFGAVAASPLPMPTAASVYTGTAPARLPRPARPYRPRPRPAPPRAAAAWHEYGTEHGARGVPGRGRSSEQHGLLLLLLHGPLFGARGRQVRGCARPAAVNKTPSLGGAPWGATPPLYAIPQRARDDNSTPTRPPARPSLPPYRRRPQIASKPFKPRQDACLVPMANAANGCPARRLRRTRNKGGRGGGGGRLRMDGPERAPRRAAA